MGPLADTRVPSGIAASKPFTGGLPQTVRTGGAAARALTITVPASPDTLGTGRTQATAPAPRGMAGP